MENGANEQIDYSFLKEEDVEKYFVDLNIALLSGRHIDTTDYAIFSVIEKYEEQWKLFYRNLYKLDLISDVFDRVPYYYLSFFDKGREKFSDNSRHRALTEMQTLTGLMLLDMYFQRYFDEQKIIKWLDIQKQIEEGDHSSQYQRILFNVIRPAYSKEEWQMAEKKFRDAINSFDKLGWVKKQSGQNESLAFEIRPAIYRMAKLYENELKDFDIFTQNVKANRNL